MNEQVNADPADERWFILCTEPRREKTAMGHLIGRGFRPYFPTELRRERVGRGLQWKVYGMFPAIIFLPLSVRTGRFDRARDTPGVLGFMRGTARNYATVDQPAIEVMRFHEVSGMDIREIPTGRPKRNVPFKPRQRVTFKEGPFGGLFAKIKAVDPKGRIRLLLDLFGRETPIEVDADEIAAA